MLPISRGVVSFFTITVAVSLTTGLPAFKSAISFFNEAFSNFVSSKTSSSLISLANSPKRERRSPIFLPSSRALALRNSICAITIAAVIVEASLPSPDGLGKLLYTSAKVLRSSNCPWGTLSIFKSWSLAKFLVFLSGTLVDLTLFSFPVGIPLPDGLFVSVRTLVKVLGSPLSPVGASTIGANLIASAVTKDPHLAQQTLPSALGTKCLESATTTFPLTFAGADF